MLSMKIVSSKMDALILSYDEKRMKGGEGKSYMDGFEKYIICTALFLFSIFPSLLIKQSSISK